MAEAMTFATAATDREHRSRRCDSTGALSASESPAASSHQTSSDSPWSGGLVCGLEPQDAPFHAHKGAEVSSSGSAPRQRPASDAKALLRCAVAARAQRELSELDVANKSVGNMLLPGNLVLIPVHRDDYVRRCLQVFEIPGVAIVLGASYFQRLLRQHDTMFHLSVDLGYFVRAQSTERSSGATIWMRTVPGNRDLLSVYVACCYLAVKVSSHVTSKGQLTAMLESVLREHIVPGAASRLEMDCLKMLDYRLGPLFGNLDSEP